AAYAADHKDMLPPSYGGLPNKVYSSGWIGNNKIYHESISTYMMVSDPPRYKDFYWCPSTVLPWNGLDTPKSTYAGNINVLTHFESMQFDNPKLRKTADIRRPSEVLSLTDSSQAGATVSGSQLSGQLDGKSYNATPYDPETAL